MSPIELTELATFVAHHAKEQAVANDYHLTEAERDQFVIQMDDQIAREEKAGTVKRYIGDLEADILD